MVLGFGCVVFFGLCVGVWFVCGEVFARGTFT